MSKNNRIIVGLIIIIVMLIGLWFWFSTSNPSNQEKKAAVKTIKPVDTNFLNNKNVKDILSQDVNSPVPVEINKDEVGRDNPFANY